ncbi:MAG TPA: DUF6122 family protein [Clostridiales bacterium]|jgi:hypothetical protein|nr:DUF6122 family protein [Clostridiales bacterium]HQP68934.1 DUF6122 family protein [Clostridiales bacterium]
MYLNFLFHNSLHLLLPLVCAFYCFKPGWKKNYLLMVSAYLIDLDHLLADPAFDPNRCSIGFHPLHSYYAVGLYALMVYFPKTRIIGIGLLIHILVDLSDCVRIYFI